MEISKIVANLQSLSHRSRLAVFRLLVRAGPSGLAAGVISKELGVRPATLSFHLSNLTETGLVNQRQSGRYIIYSADFDSMRGLVSYLTENCCAGARLSADAPGARRRSRTCAQPLATSELPGSTS